MLALAVVVLVPAVVSYMDLRARADWAYSDTVVGLWSRFAANMDTTQTFSWKPMKGTHLVFADGLKEEVDYDVTITFSAEFLISAEPGIASPAPESIEVKCVIWRLDIAEWVFYGCADPWKVVMLTEEPDSTGKNWESRSFTFVYKGLQAPYRGDVGDQAFRVHIAWRLYPASSTSYLAQVHRRSLVVTVMQQDS